RSGCGSWAAAQHRSRRRASGRRPSGEFPGRQPASRGFERRQPRPTDQPRGRARPPADQPGAIASQFPIARQLWWWRRTGRRRRRARRGRRRLPWWRTAMSNVLRRSALALAFLLGLVLAATAQTKLESFPTPEEAVNTFTEALRKNDDKTITAILGQTW